MKQYHKLCEKKKKTSQNSHFHFKSTNGPKDWGPFYLTDVSYVYYLASKLILFGSEKKSQWGGKKMKVTKKKANHIGVTSTAYNTNSWNPRAEKQEQNECQLPVTLFSSMLLRLLYYHFFAIRLRYLCFQLHSKYNFLI